MGFTLHGTHLVYVYRIKGYDFCEDNCVFYDLIDLESDSYLGTGKLYDGTRADRPRFTNFLPINNQGLFTYIERESNSIAIRGSTYNIGDQ